MRDRNLVPRSDAVGRCCPGDVHTLGAIAGDIIGSVYEWTATKTKVFPLFHSDCRFTDDTVLTVAVAEGILRKIDYVDLFHEYFQAYPLGGYGMGFSRWAGRR